MKKRLQFKHFFNWLLLLSAPALMAQWQDGLWVGRQAYNMIDSGIRTDFNSGNAVPSFGYPMSVSEGSTTLSDSAGNLLFFAGNNTIWNSTNAVMQNGDGLTGGSDSSTQFGLFVPKPGDANIYYLFNVDTPTTLSPGLTYSEIDLTLDGGLGGVTANKNIVLDADAKTEKITAVYHSDGESIWVISHRIGSNEFVAYLVTSAGVSTTPVISSIGNISPDIDPADAGIVYYWGAGGQMKAAPDGSKIASTILDGPFKGVSVFDFDNTTGTLSNFIHLTGYNGWPYGIEFSPNSHFLYTANPNAGYSDGGSVEQYDVTLPADQIAASKEVIFTVTSPWGGNGGMVLGADGRIYIKDVGGETTNAIRNPNNAGVASGYQAGALPMSNGIAMPTFNQTYLESGILHELGCPGADVTFSLLRIPDVTSVSWDFGDPASGAANTSAIASHTFSAGGTYTVTAQITSNGGVQSASITITVPDAGAVAVAPDGLTVCDGSGIFDLTTQTATIISQLGTTYTVTYYTTETNAQDGTNAITTPGTFTSTGQTIWARAANANNTCFSVVNFELQIVVPPVANPVTALSECGTTAQPNTVVFDLTQQDATLIGAQTGITVTYYPTQTDAENGTNAITTPATYTNTANPQTLVAALENAGGCIIYTSFALNVIPAPTVVALPNISLCDDATADGFTTFNLAQQDALLQAGQPGVAVAYYTSQADAEAGTNVIPSPSAFTNTVNPQTIYAAVTNTAGCSSYTSFQVNVIALPVVAQAPDLFLCDSGTNGTAEFNLTTQDAVYQQGQPGVTVDYFITEADAEANANAIATPAAYTNTQDTQTVYVRIDNGSCYAVGSFTLQVNDAPVLALMLEVTGCSPFNLTEIETGLDSGLEISYYTSEANAEQAINAIANPAEYTTNDTAAHLYVRAENADGCYTVAQLHISPGDCFIQRGISPGGSIGQNDTFDLSNLDVTKLMIYNRYGKEVFSFNGNYTNQWGGQTDNGQDLPTGTYFYMFQRNTGEAKTGWIYINRQN